MRRGSTDVAGHPGRAVRRMGAIAEDQSWSRKMHLWNEVRMKNASRKPKIAPLTISVWIFLLAWFRGLASLCGEKPPGTPSNSKFKWKTDLWWGKFLFSFFFLYEFDLAPIWRNIGPKGAGLKSSEGELIERIWWHKIQETFTNFLGPLWIPYLLGDTNFDLISKSCLIRKRLEGNLSLRKRLNSTASSNSWLTFFHFIAHLLFALHKDHSGWFLVLSSSSVHPWINAISQGPHKLLLSGNIHMSTQTDHCKLPRLPRSMPLVITERTRMWFDLPKYYRSRPLFQIVATQCAKLLSLCVRLSPYIRLIE